MNKNTFFILAQTRLSKHSAISSVIDYYNNNPQMLQQFLNELDQAIYLFHRYIQKKSTDNLPNVPCINADYLKLSLRGRHLPSVRDIMTEMKTDTRNKTRQRVDEVLKNLNDFAFIDTMNPVDKLAAALIVASYRTYILIVFPDLKDNHAQVASATEEMLALMALNGQKTKLLEATKHWIIDYNNEGFSPKLANAIQKLYY